MAKTGLEKTTAEKKENFDEEVEQTAAKAEPMGSVAAAVPRDAGSAPAHEGGHATLVAGSEARKAEKPARRKAAKAEKR
jgi:hypothetical protein